MDLRETFKKGLRWQIGNGYSVHLWTDNWVYDKPLKDLGATQLQDPNNCVKSKVRDFITTFGEWDVPKLNTVLPSNIVKDIASIHIPYNNLNDKLFWGYAPEENPNRGHGWHKAYKTNIEKNVVFTGNGNSVSQINRRHFFGMSV